MRSAVLGLAAIGLVIGDGSREARAQPPPAAGDDRTLTAAELDRYFEPYVPQVRACYLASARGPRATGAVRLEIIIHRDGSVWKLGVVAPGVTGVSGVRLERCVQKAARSWHFPVRAGFTTAAIPFYFQRTHAPGAGPRPSCSRARGCPEKQP